MGCQQWQEPANDPEDEAINALAWSPDGKSIASGNKGSSISGMSMQEQGVYTIAARCGSHGEIAFSPDDRHLAYWALGQTFKSATQRPAKRFRPCLVREADGLRSSVEPCGQHLECAGDDGSIVVYDLGKNEAATGSTKVSKRQFSTDLYRWSL